MAMKLSANVVGCVCILACLSSCAYNASAANVDNVITQWNSVAQQVGYPPLLLPTFYSIHILAVTIHVTSMRVLKGNWNWVRFIFLKHVFSNYEILH